MFNESSQSGMRRGIHIPFHGVRHHDARRSRTQQDTKRPRHFELPQNIFGLDVQYIDDCTAAYGTQYVQGEIELFE